MTIAPVWFEDFQETAEAFQVRWIDNRLKPTEAEGSDWYKVFLNGVPFVDVTEPSAVLSGLEAGKHYNVDVRLVSGVDRARWASWPFYVEPDIGSRLKVTIPEASIATNPDFFSYVLYWDEGAGTPADTLLAELVGINNTEYVTDELVDGTTYLFRVALKDTAGNEGAPGSEYGSTVETLPEAPENAALDYAGRVATLTADKPSPQDSDCVGYALYSNYLPGWGLQPYLLLDSPFRLEFFPTSAALSHTSYGLHPGNWMFAFRAIDSSGFESDFEIVTVNVGSDYLEAAAVPVAPYLIQATTIAAGKISVDITLTNTTDATHVHVYLDDVYDGEVAVASFVEGSDSKTYRCIQNIAESVDAEHKPITGSDWEDFFELYYEPGGIGDAWQTGVAYTIATKSLTYETDALVHGQTYEITARVANGAVESEDSNRTEATADDTAPTGSTVLALEVTGNA